MGNADQDIAAGLAGVAEDVNGNPTNIPLSWRGVYVRARTLLSNTLSLAPFSWPPGGPRTTSTFDQVEGTAEQTAWRYVDQDGIVWDLKAWTLVQIEWFKDGARTPVTPAMIAKYRKAADTLRNWPTTDVISGTPYRGAFGGEPTQSYPAYPPAGT